MDKMTSEEMRVIHEEFVDKYFRGNDNIVGVTRIKRTPFSWAILVTVKCFALYAGPSEFKGMKVILEHGEPGILL
jgi:hypothetical protein